MSHDVFISHSSIDKVLADATCASLETLGIRCWVAPRDVQAGLPYAGQIKRAINGSSVFVLTFSANANLSENVLREVELAARNAIHILSFRVEDIAVSDDLDYYLSAPHWLDAVTPPVEKHLEQLQKSVQSLLAASAQKIVPTAPPAARDDGPIAKDLEVTSPQAAAQRETIPRDEAKASVSPEECHQEQKAQTPPPVTSEAAPAEAKQSPPLPSTPAQKPSMAVPNSITLQFVNKLWRFLKSATAALGGTLLLLLADAAVFLFFISLEDKGVIRLGDRGAALVIISILALTIAGLVFASRFVKRSFLKRLTFACVITMTILGLLITAGLQIAMQKLGLQTPAAMSFKVSGVRAACISPDGKWIVTASEDHTARIWDAQSGAASRLTFDNGAPLQFANFSPDGQKILTIAADDTVRIWDVQSGSLVGKPLLHENVAGISSAEFSPDGKWLVTAAFNKSDSGGAARIWDVQKGTLAGKPLPEKRLQSASFSPDGRLIVTAGDSGALVWDVETRRPSGEALPIDLPGKAAFSSDGKWITSRGLVHNFKVWDVSTRKPAGKSIGCMIAVPISSYSLLNESALDGNWVLTQMDLGAAEVWDTVNGEVVHRLRHKAYFGLFKMRHDPFWIGSASFTRDCKTIVTVTLDDTVRLWRFE